ncbi:cation transport protein [Gemella bergeri ATCC 700627]|uniref:Cation transport protein n=1 Tax=Gemella bergeri ATCC 700627 TaxID=1321820 RepID=U2SD86_9BACL|nr:TrkH family potassium uptake protein [Gemella bergeri]ERK60687.1 cation transport protein [Gemella bergeri ATCC 700627]
MNYKMIFHVVGKMFKLLSALLMLPIFVSLIYKERQSTLLSFLAVAVLCYIFYFVIDYFTDGERDRDFYNREGFVIVTLTWIIFSIFGALPFYFSGEIPNYIDSLFETVSGFTTTGSTILPDIEKLDKSILLWRSFTHFIGGMGVIVFALAILPRSPHNIHIAKAEIPGPYFGKVVSSIKQTAIYLYSIYIALTVILFVLLLIGNVGVFDSLNIAFSTAGTGGFSIKNSGIAYYNSTYVTVVVAVFMLIFSMNLNIIYFVIFKKFFKALKSEELLWFLGLVALTSVIIFLDIYRSYDTPYHSLLDVFFTVSSVVSTTGFTYNNFDIWPTFSKMIILLLMIVGGCAGGTAGGIKIPRFIFFVKNAKNSISKALSPKKIISIKIDGKIIKDTNPLANYLLLYSFIFVFLLLITSIQINDFQDAISLVVTTISNAGPAFNNYGPLNNFSSVPYFTKIVLSISMLLGRLELIPLIVLFSSKTWRKRHTIKK